MTVIHTLKYSVSQKRFYLFVQIKLIKFFYSFLFNFNQDSPLSSKVAMFNNVANRHQENQLLNPFSQGDGRRSPRPQFSKEEYGKPKEGSKTEARGQKAHINVFKDMLELCEVVHSSGVPNPDDNDMRVILFGELFNVSCC